MVQVAVIAADALTRPCDVLVLKYAQASYGVDAAVANMIVQEDGQVLLPGPTGFRLYHLDRVAAGAVLFVGVPPLARFLYDEIELFVVRALTALAGEQPSARRVAFTLHGPGYGLDELACFDSMLRGIDAALDSRNHPSGLECIEIVERNPGRVERMREYVTTRGTYVPAPDGAADPRVPAPALADSPTVFMAVPFSGDYRDTYRFGLEEPLHELGLKCERIDREVFVGDVVQEIHRRIARSRLMVADLTGANPNVFLEVGYAWGREVPTVLLVRKKEMAESLTFDVRGRRCLVYTDIGELEEKILTEIPQVLAATPPSV